MTRSNSPSYSCLLLYILVLCFITNSNWAADNPFSEQQAEQTQDYICPMHPHIHGNKGDTCPVCGMDLVPAPKQSTNENPRTFTVDSGIVQAMGVRTEKTMHRNIQAQFRAYGRIVPSTRSQSFIATRVAGWIETLNANAIGDQVAVEDILYTLYSPELISAQKDYLNALTSQNNPRINATQSRLRLLGLNTSVINQLTINRKVLESVPFKAPSQGIVTDLWVRDGSYIQPGSKLLTIQDLRTLWVEAQVPEKNLEAVLIDSTVKIKHPTRPLTAMATVNFIQPMIDPDTRTTTVRLILENPKNQWLLESFVDVFLEGPTQHRLVVPIEAILRTGNDEFVLLALDKGQFQAQKVKTGLKIDGYSEIINGLKMGQQVVVSGQYLLDAEANLRFGIKKFSPEQR